MLSDSSDRKRRRVERRLDQLVDRYAEDIGHAEMELLLQRRAQEMREQTESAVSADDLEGWSA